MLIKAWKNLFNKQLSDISRKDVVTSRLWSQWSEHFSVRLTCLWLDEEILWDFHVFRSAYIDFLDKFSSSFGIVFGWKIKFQSFLRDGMANLRKVPKKTFIDWIFLPLFRHVSIVRNFRKFPPHSNLKLKILSRDEIYTSQAREERQFLFLWIECKECQKPCLTYSFCTEKRIEKCVYMLGRVQTHIEQRRLCRAEIFKVYVKNPLSQLGAVSVNLFILVVVSSHSLDSFAI